MRLAPLFTVLLFAFPAAAQFSGMPGCVATGTSACETGDTLTGTDYENVRAYSAALSSAGAHSNGVNCPAGQYPLGVTAGNAIESCTPDDDVPESGDFAAAASLDSTGAIDVTVPIANGGTASTTASGARTSLGLAIGTDVQAFDADLTDLADGSLSGSKVGTGISGNNITTGTVAEARIDGAIARDSEVASQGIGTGNPPGTCTQGTWYIQTATTLRNCVCKATDVWQCATATTFP